MHDARLLRAIFPGRLPIIGMVHLPPLPGAPRSDGSMTGVLERALEDARALADGGVDGLIIENYLDAPFHPERVPPETIAAMAIVTAEVVRQVPVPVGVSVVGNVAAAAVATAAVAGGRFVRVNVHTGAMLTDQGWIEGRAHETLRLRARLGAPVAIVADVMVKHAVPPAGLDIAQAARDAWHRGLADGLIVSGGETGAATDPARALAVKRAVPEAPVWIGSGLTTENAAELLAHADGAIVGTAFARGGRAGTGIDPDRVRALLEVVRRLR